MMRFFKLIREFFVSDAEEIETPTVYNPPRVRPRPAPQQKQTPTREAEPDLSFSSDVGGRIDDGGPGKNVLIRNKYVREDTGTHETLKILDDSILENEDEMGADPYNTGRFDRSKSWNTSRFRK